MTYGTIDNDVTMAGGAQGALLANRFRIVKQLGQGGMGSVWLAEDTQLDNKQFAIKMLPSILVSNKRAYAQLKSEALVAMKLTHPNIVTLRAFEENNGNPFLVMDYVDGETLDDYLAECGDGFSTQRRRDEMRRRSSASEGRFGEAEPEGCASIRECAEVEDGRARSPSGPQSTCLPESEVVRILKPIAAALDYAHSKGVVHRDVKPGNVMIAKDGTPFILDFGIAREIQETMTRVTGKLSSGTLLYMSPEQLNGDAPRPAQDVYSFAAMAYECLKGEPPFSRGNIEFQIMNKQPEPLVDVSAAGSLSVGVNGQAARSTSIAASVMAGLAKKPEDRPPTCLAVIDGGCSGGVPPSRNGGDAIATSHVDTLGPSKGCSGGVSPSHSADGVDDDLKQVAIKSRVEAKIREKHVGELPDENGFAERKRSLADDMLRAELFFESGGWTDAAAMFSRYYKDCDALALLAKEMQDAESRRGNAVRARSGAKHIKESDSPLLCSANQTLAEAERRFADMQFSTAATLYERAQSVFERAAKECLKTGDIMTLSLPSGAIMKMIYVAPGEFVMGSPVSEKGRYDDEIQHMVRLTKGFWLGVTPVTQEQWQSVMGNNPSDFKGATLPVEMVSWNDCQEFVKKVNAKLDCGAKLPTEAEWEYACRAGATGPYGGNGILEKMGWYDNTFWGFGLQSHPVAQKKPNAWGFYDMHGNVWEWCNDWYGNYSNGSVTDPTGPASGVLRVLRGGGWGSIARDCRSAYRDRSFPGFRNLSYGFRLCCSAGLREGGAER